MTLNILASRGSSKRADSVKLEQDKDASSSAAETEWLEKQIKKLQKMRAELGTFDEKPETHG